MWLDILIISLGFAGLIRGADKFVAGASTIALNFSVAILVIGVTTVAFGTSAPEFFSPAVVAIALATVIGPLSPPSYLLHQELPAVLLVTVVTGLLFAELHLGVFDSLAPMTLVTGSSSMAAGTRVSSVITGLTMLLMTFAFFKAFFLDHEVRKNNRTYFWRLLSSHVRQLVPDHVSTALKRSS